MAGQKERFYNSIRDGDWDGVCEYYKQMYDEEPPNPPTGDGSDSLDPEEVNVRVAEKVNSFISRFISFAEDNRMEENSPTTVQYTDEEEDSPPPTAKKKRKSAEKKPKREFISLPSAKNDKKYAKELEEHARKSRASREANQRSAYTPLMKNCGLCGVSFDYHKEYPTGSTVLSDKREKKNQPVRCNKCRGKN